MKLSVILIFALLGSIILLAAPSQDVVPNNADVILLFDNGTNEIEYSFKVLELTFIEDGYPENSAHIVGTMMLNNKPSDAVNFNIIRKDGASNLSVFEPWDKFVAFMEEVSLLDWTRVRTYIVYVRTDLTTFEYEAGTQVADFFDMQIEMLQDSDPFNVLKFDLASLLGQSLSCDDDEYECDKNAGGFVCSDDENTGVYTENADGSYGLVDGDEANIGDPVKKLDINFESGFFGIGGEYCGSEPDDDNSEPDSE